VTAFGLDFGTTNSVLAQFTANEVSVLQIDEPPSAEWEQFGYHFLMPTVFAVGDDNQPLFGFAAKMREDNKIEAIKRLFKGEEVVEIGGQCYLVEEVAALLFAHIRQAAVTRGGPEVHEAVVTIPANSRGLARARTKICAGMGGLQVLTLINEPTAAAMAHGYRSPGDKTVLVVDWGGGTLDVTLLESMDQIFHEQSSSGVIECGGLDFDRILFNKLKATSSGVASWSQTDVGALRIECEKAKIKLSTQEETNVAMPGGDYRHVTRRFFEEETKALIERVRVPIERTLSDGGRQPSDIDALLLVGGTCKIPAVRQYISELLDIDPSSDVDPMTAIAEGAAIAAAIMSGDLESADFLVSTEHSLGTLIVGPDGQSLQFDEIIPKNHKLPAKETETYVPHIDFQEAIRVRILEGDPAKGFGDPDIVELRSWEVAVPPRPREDTSFDLTYEYTVDGIVHVTLVDNVTGQAIFADDVTTGVTQDKRQLVAIADRVGQTIDSNEVQHTEVLNTTRDPETLLLLQQARQKVMPFLDDEQAAKMAELVATLDTAQTEASAASARDALATELRKYSYLL